MANLNRSKEWRNTLDDLMAGAGVTLQQIAEYIDVPYNGKETGFYSKLPQKRKKFIGIGMALGLPLSEINSWILRYSGKRRLYIKDISEDLIWIYLIGLNNAASANAAKVSEGAAPNYFRMFEKCQDSAYVVYRQLWDEIIAGSVDTSELEVRFEKLPHDDDFKGLREFIVDNIDSFKTAYSKPRKMLDRYVACILNGLSDPENIANLNSLRGYLDDSMINFLSGDSNIINVIDMRSKVRTVGIKNIPTGRKTHISLCLALGMTVDEIDEYLSLMGYDTLSRQKETERQLAEVLPLWEEKHKLQRNYKDQFIKDAEEISLSPEEQLQAAESMLLLRQDLREEYSKRGWSFPYYHDKSKERE